MSMNNKIIVICGPTASGKTSIAIGLANLIGAEIISADSMQIYKELNIGTAKPTKEELAKANHHLIDIVSIASGPFSVAKYVKQAEECAREILQRGKRVIVCGGTGLYIDHFLNGTDFAECESDPAYREKLEGLPGERLHQMLAEIDAESAGAIHQNNKKRLVRALEIYKTTGKTKSELDRLSKAKAPERDFVKIALNYSERSELYGKIDRRVDQMMADGLLCEAKTLCEAGHEARLRQIGAIGYVELTEYFSGLCGLEEAVEKIKQHTRNYAKRQLTWFSKDKKTIWIEPGGDCLKNCMAKIEP